MAFNVKEYKRAWYKENKERILKARKENYYIDQEETLQKKTKYNLQNPERVILHRVRCRAKKHNVPFELELKDIVIPTHCSILGIPIIVEKRTHGKKGPKASSPSVDRIDNTKGYVRGNIQIISNKANIMKHNASPEELVLFALWVLKTYKSQI